ncbi:MAG: OmpA family protein [Myxococcota bacterium]
MIFVRLFMLVVFMSLPAALAGTWADQASDRLALMEAAADETTESVAVASAANEEYCSVGLQKVLRRVLQSCGLLESGSVRGCEPADAKTVATMSGNDFNALFRPMKERGGIIQFDQESSELDPEAARLVDDVFADQRGASYFFIVSRASPEGSAQFNKELSEKRAKAVMSRIQEKFDDPDLKNEVGLLWLGEEYAQLDEEFCTWRRSRDDECSPRDLNRSAFIAWIDCTL